ncbi:hypothetical protein [Planctopirus limnophila]|nr:hypothetical protein [Planctopirus limnophila]
MRVMILAFSGSVNCGIQSVESSNSPLVAKGPVVEWIVGELYYA